MNLVGKIFVVLILVMSVTFMAFSVMVYATHKNWKEEIDRAGGYKETHEKDKAENARLDQEIKALTQAIQGEKTALIQVAAKQETENQKLKTEKSEADATVEQLTKTQTEATSALKVSQQNLASARQQVEELATKVREAQQAESTAFARAADLTNKLHVAMGNLDTLTTREADLSKELIRLRNLAKNEGSAAPQIDGIVLAVAQGGDLVELSLGSDDGLQVGHELDVFRDNKYMGRVRVVSTSPDKAVGSAIKTYSQGVIQKGDRVATTRQA